MSLPGLESYVFRARTRQINPMLLQKCDLENPNRLEGHSLHAIASQQRHFVLAPCISDGVVQPCYFICIWSCSPGHNSLWRTEPPAEIKCNLFHCYFPSQFTGMQFIMAGTFGSAYRAVWNRGDGGAPLNVVVKRIDLARIDTVDGQDLILVLREKMLLQRLHNDHISSIILQYNDPKNSDIVYFVLEDGGPSTLDNFLRDAIYSQIPIMPSNVVTIMCHLLRGVAFLHHNRIMHRDIKGDNICMSGFVSRIIDFGMARSLIFDGVRADGGEMVNHHIRYAEQDEENEEEMDDSAFVPRMVSSCNRSTAQYSAPEALLSRGHYDSKVDVWALGCLLSELLYCCDAQQLKANSTLPTKFTARFLFRPANGDSLPLILGHVVAPAEDLVDASPGGNTKRLSDRLWSSMTARGFIDATRGVSNAAFPWKDLSSKFPVPELPVNEVPIFEKLRALMLRMLTFDPDQRCSAAEALVFLTGCDFHPVRVADNVLKEFITLQQMLDDAVLRHACHRDHFLDFIRHVDPEHPSHPSPLSLLLK